jgi:hypothetical protein
MQEANYEAFWNALPQVSILRSRPDLQEEFRRAYREEIIGLLSMLHRLGLVWGATTLHPEPPCECDQCASQLADVPYFVDGRAPHGGWANMCPRCFLEDGHSIGWGKGQLYVNSFDGSWRLVAGGNPEATDDRK